MQLLIGETLMNKTNINLYVFVYNTVLVSAFVCNEIS